MPQPKHYNYEAVLRALTQVKKRDKQPPETNSLPQRQIHNRTEWEEAVYQVKNKLGNNVYSWIEKNESLCINLLVCSQSLILTIKQNPLIKMFPAVFVIFDKYKEYSFMITPAAKAYEGILLRILVIKREITENDFNNKFINVGKYYKDNNKTEAPVKKYVREKDKNIVNKLYDDWFTYRNRVLHFDKKSLVANPEEAKKIIESIYESIKYAHLIFFG